jgi:hypothetical protein
MIRLRRLDESDAMIHIPRLLAITIPLLIITMAHIANALGANVPGWLVDPTINLAMVVVGGVIAVLGLSVGILPLIGIVAITFGFALYFYLNYTLGII